MPEPTGTDVNQNGAGSSSGSEPIVDQEISIKVGDREVKLKTSDIVDENGIPFKNKAEETARKLQEARERLEASQVTPDPASTGGRQPNELKPGEYLDPSDGKVYTEEDLNRMFMTGEGAKANRIQMAQVDIRKAVVGVIAERDTRNVVLSTYPDLKNVQSPFFKRVANYMAAEGLFGNPQGLKWAASAVAEQMEQEGLPVTRIKTGSAEGQRSSQTGAGVVPGGRGSPDAGGKLELTPEAKAMAQRLGINEEAYAKRLNTYLNNPRKRRTEEE